MHLVSLCTTWWALVLRNIGRFVMTFNILVSPKYNSNLQSKFNPIPIQNSTFPICHFLLHQRIFLEKSTKKFFKFMWRQKPPNWQNNYKIRLCRMWFKDDKFGTF